jgi:hypothetical protein
MPYAIPPAYPQAVNYPYPYPPHPQPYPMPQYIHPQIGYPGQVASSIPQSFMPQPQLGFIQ